MITKNVAMFLLFVSICWTCGTTVGACSTDQLFSGACFWTDDGNKLQKQIQDYCASQGIEIVSLLESLTKSENAKSDLQELARIKWSSVFDKSLSFGFVQVDSKFEPFFLAQTSKQTLIPKCVMRLENVLKDLGLPLVKKESGAKDESELAPVNSFDRLPGYWVLKNGYFCWSTSKSAIDSTMRMTTEVCPCDSLRKDRGFNTIIAKTGGNFRGNRFFVSKGFIRFICEQQFGAFSELAWRKMELNNLLGAGGSIHFKKVNTNKQKRAVNVDGFCLVAQPKSGIYRVLKETNGLGLDLPAPSKMRTYFEVEISGENLFNEIVKIYDDIQGKNSFDALSKEFQEKWDLDFRPSDAARQLSHFAVLTYPENSDHSHPDQNAVFWSLKIKEPNRVETILDQLALAKSMEMRPMRLEKVVMKDTIAWVPSESSVNEYLTQVHDQTKNMREGLAERYVRNARRFAESSSCLCRNWFVMAVTQPDIKKMIQTGKRSDSQLTELQKAVGRLSKSHDRKPMCVYAIWPQQMSKDFKSLKKSILRPLHETQNEINRGSFETLVSNTGPIVFLFFEDRVGYRFNAEFTYEE